MRVSTTGIDEQPRSRLIPIHYIVSAKMTRPLRHRVAEQKQWLNVDPGIDVAEFEYQGFHWGKARRHGGRAP